jgi:hypothetical protein
MRAEFAPRTDQIGIGRRIMYAIPAVSLRDERLLLQWR